MNFDAIYKKASEDVGGFWERARQRWDAAQAKSSKSLYKADDLAADVTAFWVDAVKTWSGLMPTYPSGVLPIVFIDLDVAAAGTFYVPDDVVIDPADPNATLPCTALGQIGGSGTIADTCVVAKPVSTGEVEVTITLPTPPPAPGLYQGLVIGAKPMAVILAQVS